MSDDQCPALDRIKAESSPPQPCPLIEDHIGEELRGGPCEAEVTQEHIRQLREIIVLQQHALAVVQRFMFDVLPSGDARVDELNDYMDVEFPWIN